MHAKFGRSDVPVHLKILSYFALCILIYRLCRTCGRIYSSKLSWAEPIHGIPYLMNPCQTYFFKVWQTLSAKHDKSENSVHVWILPEFLIFVQWSWERHLLQILEGSNKCWLNTCLQQHVFNYSVHIKNLFSCENVERNSRLPMDLSSTMSFFFHLWCLSNMNILVLIKVYYI